MKLFTCFLLFTFMLFPQSHWFWQNPTPQGNDLNDVVLAASSIGYAVGNFGTILKTTDAGISWNNQYPEEFSNEPYTVFNLYGIAFSNSTNGIAVGRENLSRDKVIFRTTDGGSNWFIEEIGGQSTLHSVLYADANTVFTSGEYGVIFKSTDAGETWVQQTTGITVQTLFGLSFSSVTNGIGVGAEGKIITTADGGTTWTIRTSGTTNDLYSVAFVNSTLGIAVGEAGTILKTLDGGTTWTSISSSTTNDLKDIAFIDINNFSVVGANGTILRSTDGGGSWTLKTSGTTQTLNALSFNGTVGLAVGLYGTTVKTINEGSTWLSLSKLVTFNNLSSVSFVNKNFGAAVGTNGTILKTNNGGTTWTLQSSGTTVDLNAVSFATPNLGIAVGGGLILRTMDGGATWTEQEHYLNTTLTTVEMVNANTGYAAGQTLIGSDWYGAIVKTIDGGVTWTVVYLGTYRFTAMSFLDANVGAVLSWEGVLKTTDGGMTWDFIAVLYASDDIAYTDVNSITIVGAVGIIRRTTDGGLTWVYQDAGTMQDLSAVSFSDNNNGIIVGWGFDPDEFAEGVILKTTDAGSTWNTDYTYGVRFTDVDFINNNTASVVGTRGTILRMAREKKVKKDAAELITPTQFQLYQNYPNPFNPDTRIRFSVAQQQLVQIKIYDVLGKEVAVLVNDILPVGNYERNWNASSYASGIYYYRLTSGSFTASRKMILIK